MIIVYGTRFYGKVKAAGTSYLGTKFFHIWYVPLIPIETHLILQENGNGGFRGIKSPFNVKSMLAAYLRVWGPIAVVAAIAIGFGAISDFSDDPTAMAIVGVFTGVVTLALFAGTVLSYAVLGQLSRAEKQKRAVYALHLGYAVDPEDMGDARHAFRDGLMSTIVERARGMASMGYRMNADPAQAWPHLALDPTHNDDALITAAFTLSRLEAASAQGQQKLQMEQIHDQIWQRIERSNAPYLQIAA
ncbi:MAG: hypothetical protein JWP97_3032 [Labilithrix sp.]|nr:hypothetical protein [Labilithrix sp.]